jgi:hypothetical protein
MGRPRRKQNAMLRCANSGWIGRRLGNLGTIPKLRPDHVIARHDRAIQYPQAGDYWIARSSRAMTTSYEST